MREPFLLLLAENLLVSSRIETAAHHLGYTVRLARNAAELQRGVQDGPTAVLVAVNSTTLDWEELLQEVRSQPDAPPVLAFGSHLDAAASRRARAAGVTRWATNAQIAANLPELLTNLVSRGARAPAS